nr:MAG TPA: hypothetical protein [Caudoviricetes sp.]
MNNIIKPIVGCKKSNGRLYFFFFFGTSSLLNMKKK